MSVMASTPPQGLDEDRSCERGATSVEYALLIGFIAAAIVATVLLLGTNVATLFDVDFTPGP